MEQVVAKYLEQINKGGASGEAGKKSNLFDEPVKIFTQICLHKIPNLINQKQVLCKLPNSLYNEDNSPEVCLIVKDAVNEKKNRDFDQTIRKYQKIIDAQKLNDIVKKILPIKQIKLEFRPFEIKRKLSTSFNLFIADKGLHDILYSGSHLGREFQRRKKMPIEVDLEKHQDDLKQVIDDILGSTIIRLNGKGAIIDIHAFNSTNTVDEAMANINAIKEKLEACLPGGLANIKAIYLKATNESLTLPIYVSNPVLTKENGSESNDPADDVKLKNNMTKLKKLKRKKKETKRLKKSAAKREKGLKKKEKRAKKAVERNLIKGQNATKESNGQAEAKPKAAKEAKPASKPTKPELSKPATAAKKTPTPKVAPKQAKVGELSKKKKINLVK